MPKITAVIARHASPSPSYIGRYRPASVSSRWWHRARRPEAETHDLNFANEQDRAIYRLRVDREYGLLGVTQAKRDAAALSGRDARSFLTQRDATRVIADQRMRGFGQQETPSQVAIAAS